MKELLSRVRKSREIVELGEGIYRIKKNSENIGDLNSLIKTFVIFF